jgi:hypothetical protein
LPGDVVKPEPWGADWSDAESDAVCDCDILVADMLPEGMGKVAQRFLACGGGRRLVRIVRLRFAGFLPDLCYAVHAESGALTRYHYNSAIAVWAYRNGLSPADTATLFNDRVFRALGYYECFDREMVVLRRAFALADISFADLFLALKRTGLFMYTYNHPKIATLDRIARLIARAIEGQDAIAAHDLGVADGLDREIWPVYPEIADELALAEGSWTWKIDGVFVSGLKTYLEQAFATYEAQGIARGDLRPRLVNGLDECAYDRHGGGRYSRPWR